VLRSPACPGARGPSTAPAGRASADRRRQGTLRRMVDRNTVQTTVRIAAIVFVVAWLFVEALREVVPFWLPFAALLPAEVEFVVRGRRELPLPRRRRIPPGPEDADLGFGELVEEEDGYRYIPPPTRPPRGRGGGGGRARGGGGGRAPW